MQERLVFKSWIVSFSNIHHICRKLKDREFFFFFFRFLILKKKKQKHKASGAFDFVFVKLMYQYLVCWKSLQFLMSSQGAHERFLMKYFSSCTSFLKIIVHKCT